MAGAPDSGHPVRRHRHPPVAAVAQAAAEAVPAAGHASSSLLQETGAAPGRRCRSASRRSWSATTSTASSSPSRCASIGVQPRHPDPRAGRAQHRAGDRGRRAASRCSATPAMPAAGAAVGPHRSRDVAGLPRAVAAARAQREAGALVTFGIVPTRAGHRLRLHRGGRRRCRQRGAPHRALRREARRRHRARATSRTGGFLWNSGMFAVLARSAISTSWRACAPDIAAAARARAARRARATWISCASTPTRSPPARRTRSTTR